MSQITPRPIYQKTPNGRGTPTEKRFNSWLHTNGSCIVTGQPTFEIAHVGGLSEGKGMSRKSVLGTCLPLIMQLHMAEEMGRGSFWASVGLPDYLQLAKGLYEIFKEGLDPTAFLAINQGRIDRDYVRALLGEIDY